MRADAERLHGSLIDGRYRVERAIASGGFGTVYAAFHVGLGSPVALKVLELPERLRPEQLAKRVGDFLEEARTLKRLRHPNIVAALDVGLLPEDADGFRLPYIVMEWCGGPTLKKHLDERGGRPMSLREAWHLFAPLLAAIEHAHASGVAHRDLKPANILLEAAKGEGSFTPRVIDFGIAKILSMDESAGSGKTSTASGSSPFTPRYAAPEQLAGARTGPWTDVHALGLVFVEMVIGRPAIEADGDGPMAGIEATRPTPKARGVDVGALEAVLARALALRPADRYPDAAALARAMEAVAKAGWPEVTGLPLDSRPAITSIQKSAVAVGANGAAPPSSQTAPTTEVGMDFTAPPSSHTVPTTGGRSVQTSPRRTRSRRWIAASAGLALLLALGGATGFQRWRGAWPFPHKRFHEVSVEEIDRRLATTGLGTCTSYSTGLPHIATCERGSLIMYQTRLPPTMSLKDVRTYVNVAARSMAQEKAAKFAIDGDLALVVAATPELVSGALDTVIGNAVVDLRDSVDDPTPIPTVRSDAAAVALAAWTGGDLIASVQATGQHVAYANGQGYSPAVVVSMDDQVATVLLQTQDIPMKLANWKTTKTPFAYAIDGDRLLVVTGSAAFRSVGFLKRILAGARATEFGVYPAE